MRKNKKRNMSNIDRVIRTVMGLGLIYIGVDPDILTSDLLSRILLAAVGAFTLVSGITGHCSIYQIAGFDTYKKNCN